MIDENQKMLLDDKKCNVKMGSILSKDILFYIIITLKVFNV